jgi:hypothetical protein
MSFDPTPWTNMLALFLALAAVITLFARWISKGAKKRAEHADEQRAELVALIEQVARQVQPRNGGEGWSDTRKDVKELLANQAGVMADVALLKQSVLQLEDDVDGMK